MKVIYVAGPYTADTDWQRGEFIRKAGEVNAHLWRMGFCSICPHRITAFYGGLCEESVFIEGGLEILRRCDVVVLVEGWERSGGTLGEIEEAVKLSIPVYETVYNFIAGTEIDYERAGRYINQWRQRKTEE